MDKITERLYPTWMQLPLPSNVERITALEEKPYLNRASNILERRLWPSPLYPNREIYWPKPNIEARAVRETILPLDYDDGFDDAEKIDRFFKTATPKGVVVWGLGCEEYGLYQGCYTNSFREWITTQLVFQPVCVLAVEQELCLIVEHATRFSVIGGDSSLIELFEEIWGGASVLRGDFLSYLEEGSVGFGAEDNEATKNWILPWCGW
ncbi:hypothetical protein [Kordiimonas laminariae]|uniref:hypothetical protein n=1 Tax=Kordiimonas laminariae TaxID=2917717 RepID=UPI001FF4C294|nr:hypothetical protein [Kordiimonas laminariae]MCK0067964.1 hypothetical protein [Kordiimonas laminariae]